MLFFFGFFQFVQCFDVFNLVGEACFVVVVCFGQGQGNGFVQVVYYMVGFFKQLKWDFCEFSSLVLQQGCIYCVFGVVVGQDGYGLELVFIIGLIEKVGQFSDFGVGFGGLVQVGIEVGKCFYVFFLFFMFLVLFLFRDLFLYLVVVFQVLSLYFFCSQWVKRLVQLCVIVICFVLVVLMVLLSLFQLVWFERIKFWLVVFCWWVFCSVIQLEVMFIDVDLNCCIQLELVVEGVASIRLFLKFFDLYCWVMCWVLGSLMFCLCMICVVFLIVLCVKMGLILVLILCSKCCVFFRVQVVKILIFF